MIIKHMVAKQLLYKQKIQPFLYIFHLACITQPQEVQTDHDYCHAQTHSQRPILSHEKP